MGRRWLLAGVAEPVHGTRNRRRQLGAIHQAHVFQFLESLGEQIGRDAWQLGAKTTVAARSAEQLTPDQQRPPLTGDVEPLHFDIFSTYNLIYLSR
jgi:hypothetical protein